jgi:hypothetical protein
LDSVSLRVCVVTLLVVTGGCAGKGGGGTTDAGGDGNRDAAGEASCADASTVHKANGQACGCNADCQSGFCTDGVCCNTACGDTCHACNLPASLGTCAVVPAGQPPRTPAVCPATDASSCGLDGTCDGRGACRRHQAGTVCRAGSCNGDSVDGIYVCDGSGSCTPGAAVICAPFGCDDKTQQCVSTCAVDSDCVSGRKCVAGSCGKKPRGAVCNANADCASGFCTDHVCCNIACTGACLSCAQVGRMGTCWPIDAGNADPRGICVDQGSGSCGHTGACDGLGSCASYPAETVCVAASCTGDRLNTAGTCDGVGTCRPSGVSNCAPYRCTAGACNDHCTVDADCTTGIACVAGSCGPKQNGQACTRSAECASNFCVDGVCCADACQGACRSCALPSSLGTCMPTPAGGSDPRGFCVDQTAASCGTDGKCDGARACRRYPTGTVCAAESCDHNVYTPASLCSATGTCTAPSSLPCAPFACNGGRCFAACTNDANCLPPNVCNGNSCGPKMIGSFCSASSECASGNCAQGICCVTACAGPCRSCALSGSMGVCTNVPTGAPDPANTCVDQGTLGCGTDGKCSAGACRKYAAGTACKDPSCASTTFTPGSTCDGAGTCVTPGSSSCFPFRCGAAACKSACTADADCAAPALCMGGSCGLKGLAAACATGVECQSGICAQGVCCGTTCTARCKSCAVPGSAGTCAPVPAGGPDPTASCTNAGAASCGTTGFCDGSGACDLYPAGTQCAAPSCPVGNATQTLARTCDGAGTCRPATMQDCTPFACNGAACNSTCHADADCVAPAICDPTTNLCGDKKRLGQLCSGDTDCLAGNFCVDGVCCATSSCPSCQSCRVMNKEGTCNNVPADDPEPHNLCVPQPPCGLNGACDGLGACEVTSPLVSCGTTSCTGSMAKAVGHCDGTAGTCVQVSASCGAYQCGATACLTACTADGDCIAGDTCQGGSCTSLKPNGVTCAGDGDCLNGHCAQGFCCDGPCGGCKSCALTPGTCTVVPAGQDPNASCDDMGVATCGTDGACDGAGACRKYAAGSVCIAASCPATGSIMNLGSTCDGSGACVANSPATLDCAPFLCDGTACWTSCGDAGTNCVAGSSCVSGVCQ